MHKCGHHTIPYLLVVQIFLLLVSVHFWEFTSIGEKLNEEEKKG